MSTISDPAMKELESSIGKYVLIRIRNGMGIRGILAGYDSHLNLVSKSAEEIGEAPRTLGDIIVRGDNVVMISPAEE